MQPERRLKSALTEAFSAKYRDHANAWYTYISPGPGVRTGMPDLLLGIDRRSCWVEAKSAGKPLRPRQRIAIDDLIRSGQRVVVVREGPALHSTYISLGDQQVRIIEVPRPALRHDPFWELLWN